MTALVDTGHVPDKNFPFNDFRITDSRFTSQAFGREPNALPKLCNCYAYSIIKAPDKGEVGGSSPPRPTIQITNKHAVILTFPRLGNLPQKAVLSTCQLPVSRVGLHSGRSEAT